MENESIGEKFVNAIIKHEGWLPANEERKFNGSRSFRNNNPGNLRSSPFANGKAGNFATFANAEIGRKALVWDLKKKSIGETRTGLTGESTLADLIRVYAPESDGNKTDAYIQAVMNETGLKHDKKIGEIFAEIELPEFEPEPMKEERESEIPPEIDSAPAPAPVKPAPVPTPAPVPPAPGKPAAPGAPISDNGVEMGTYKLLIMKNGDFRLVKITGEVKK